MIVAQGSDVANFPVFADDMTNGTQSVIAVPANAAVVFFPSAVISNSQEPYSVSFKIVIQKPIDPSFSYSITWDL